MALSLSNFLYHILLLLLPFGLIAGCSAQAQTYTYDWNVEWVTRNPDGMMERPVISLNGEWPWPLLNFTKGSRVIATLHNKLGNESTSVHFHGLFQNGTNDMDGPVGVTQCDIPPGGSMTYNFTIDQPGTYWYHSHSRGQYPDGARGQYIVHDPDSPYAGQYDEEVAFTVSDWYHEEIAVLIPQFINYKNPTGAEPVPNSALMNDTQNLTISVEPEKTYFFRISSVAGFAAQYFWIEDHELTIIQVDGVWTKPAKADMLYIGAGQRYGFLVTTKQSTAQNFAMVGSMDTSYFDVVPPGLNANVTGWLMYDDNKPKPQPKNLSTLYAYDDFDLVPYDELKLFENVGKKIELLLQMETRNNGANYAFFNNVTYTEPVVPTLYSVLSTGEAADNAFVYGTYTNSYVLDKGDVVEIVLNSIDGGKHPFHLHGHDFQAVYRSGPNGGAFDASEPHNFPVSPMRRDVFLVRPNGNFVIRWVADNPGVWFFHCHIDWHLATGLAATMVEAPLDLQRTLKVPEGHYDNCRALNQPFKGNAAGNTVDVYDLSGQNKDVKPLPSGFTAGGIVALVFSAIAAVLGMAVIAWYGAAPLGSAELASAKNFISKAEGSTGGS